MTIFQHVLWGYELTYPDGWVHQIIQDADGFAAIAEAIDMDYADEQAGMLLVRGEWNWARQPVEPFWNRHVGLLAGMLTAKQVGSAPWQMGGGAGLEAEIVLPKRDNRRLWLGILARDFRILHFIVTHPKDQREQFEPAATRIISSLRFPVRIAGLKQTREGLPLPPDYSPMDPRDIMDDIAAPEQWRAYDGQASIGALQAFYLREAPIHDWEMTDYVPFPGPSELGFARIKLRRGNQQITLGIMPFDKEKLTSASPAKLIYKLG